MVAALCPICNKRRAERYCPAKGTKICAVDCGTEREVTIDCPSDCSYLAAAHRWEQEHPRTVSEKELPFRDVSLSPDLIQTHGAVLSGLVYTLLDYARAQPSLSDTDLFDGLQTLAETYRTLLAGICYEKPPGSAIAAGLYGALAKFIEEEKKREATQPGAPVANDTDLFHLLVLLARLARMRSNGRPRARVFLDSLREQFPVAPVQEEPRIVIP